MLAKIFSAIVVFFQSILGLQPADLPSKMSAQVIPPVSESRLTDFVTTEISPIFPIRRWDVPEPELSASSAIIFNVSANKILYQKDIYGVYPIASLTKLMTALVFLEYGSLDQEILVSRDAVSAYGTMGKLVVGEKITARNLLYALLIQSSNDAAVALMEDLNGRGLDVVKLMNKKAKKLALENTYFEDTSGLSEKNVSTAMDLVLLTKAVLKNDLLRDIMATTVIDVASVDGKYNHHLVNTNKLLGRLSEVIGGKTGYTEEAGQCMILITKIPEKDDIIISIVLNSADRLGESEQLANWTRKAYVF